MPKSWILVSSDHNTFTQFSSESLAHFRRAVHVLSWAGGILRSLQDFSPSCHSVLPIVLYIKYIYMCVYIYIYIYIYIHTVGENNYLICICVFLCVCVCVRAIFPASLNWIKLNLFSIFKTNDIELYCLQHRFSIHSMVSLLGAPVQLLGNTNC